MAYSFTQSSRGFPWSLQAGQMTVMMTMMMRPRHFWLRFLAWGAAFVVEITVLAILVPATGRVAASMPSAAQQAAMAANSAAEAAEQNINLAAGVEVDESEPGLSAEELGLSSVPDLQHRGRQRVGG